MDELDLRGEVLDGQGIFWNAKLPLKASSRIFPPGPPASWGSKIQARWGRHFQKRFRVWDQFWVEQNSEDALATHRGLQPPSLSEKSFSPENAFPKAGAQKQHTFKYVIGHPATISRLAVDLS